MYCHYANRAWTIGETGTRWTRKTRGKGGTHENPRKPTTGKHILGDPVLVKFSSYSMIFSKTHFALQDFFDATRHLQRNLPHRIFFKGKNDHRSCRCSRKRKPETKQKSTLPFKWQDPSSLVNSIGRALHQHSRGQGFKSRISLNSLQALHLRLQSCVYKTYNYSTLPQF